MSGNARNAWFLRETPTKHVGRANVRVVKAGVTGALGLPPRHAVRPKVA